ncbi:hypothetical protein AQUCO_05200027v1 [Aquilegia coerulea]|uniref:Uncharacterized protein n=1 Tax=Aquilegia coerulea TaxID=218851 RepID=A0A2G5CIL5_AQUCA|nr:hypothetical protein AQUCO_05200027v1 [Aquilegia coerulea]
MERSSEPTLVPEWLKGTGHITGSGSSNHHFVSSLLSDEPGVALPARNRSSLNIGDYDSAHSSAILDRTSSSYFRRSSSSNGSMGHDRDTSSHSRSYSSFGRSYRDRDRDRDWDRDTLDFREKDRSILGIQRERDYSNADVFASRTEKDMFRRSQSMISGKRGEMGSRKVVADANSNNSHSNHNGTAGGNKIVHIHQATFERDFPSLGVEEKQGIDRVASPGLSIAAQSLPMGSSAMIMGNGWTSALAEVPVITGSNSANLPLVPQTAASSLGSLATSTTTGLNMAETLAQAPLRARTAPQLSVETQRLEELALKQSRQLIPMTPSMPKNSVLNAEKQKTKASVRSEISMGNKIGQQQLSSSHPGNHPLRGGTARPDAKTSAGKLLVLKPRENGISHTTKDSSSPTSSGRTVINPLAVTPSVGQAPMKNQNNPKLVPSERKATVLPANNTPTMEKKPINPQAQSRNDFFNLMRKKTLTNNSSAVSDPGHVASPTILEKSGELTHDANAVSTQGGDVHTSDHSSLNADPAVVGSNGDAYENSHRIPKNGEKHSSSPASLCPDEEEAAFLRSLGWEEDAREDELTEEEINAFYQEYMKLKPSSKLCLGMRQSKLPLQLDSCVDENGGASGSSSSESKSKA